MRSWWEEGYKPPVCISSSSNSCAGQPTFGGVGLGLWLSYGDNPPPGAKFNLGLAAQHIWQWWWQRRAIGDTGGASGRGLFVRKEFSSAGGPYRDTPPALAVAGYPNLSSKSYAPNADLASGSRGNS